MLRTQPPTKQAKISSTTNLQMLQWLHGKQQQQQREDRISGPDRISGQSHVRYTMLYCPGADGRGRPLVRPLRKIPLKK